MSKFNKNSAVINVLALLGPTASGKTMYAMELAQKYNWEILSCDSRQIYNRMDIGTAKPDKEQQKSVKHWCIDIIDPDKLYSAVEFASNALEIIKKRNAEGRTVLICGGTGLYFKALSEGIEPGIETDPEIKDQLMKKGAEIGAGSLHDELSKIDPVAAQSINKNDLQRIVRALAVFHQTGVPFSKSRKPGIAPEGVAFRAIKLTAPRNLLYEKIDKRVITMVDAGLIDECRNLLGMYGPSAPGLQCVGYKELIPYYDGKISKDSAIEDIQRNSRRYAKRQCTWFNNQVTGMEIESGSSIQAFEEYYKNFVT